MQVTTFAAQTCQLAPVFGVSKAFDNLSAGEHTFELRNMSGVVYVDGFCVTGGTSSGVSSTTLTATSSSNATDSSITVPANAQALSVVAESTPSLPLQIVVVDPNGVTLATSDGTSGLTSLDVPVSSGGVYLVKVLNLGLGAVNVRSAATAVVPR